MRALNVVEMKKVSGGTDAVQAARNVCTSNNLPADTKVIITITAGTEAGAIGISTSTDTTITIETTCGEITKKDK